MGVAAELSSLTQPARLELSNSPFERIGPQFRQDGLLGSGARDDELLRNDDDELLRIDDDDVLEEELELETRKLEDDLEVLDGGGGGGAKYTQREPNG